MAKKCIYCSAEIPEESVIDFCARCGIGVWGEKMFKTIVENMENAHSNGDLCHDRPITEDVDNQNGLNLGNGFPNKLI